MSEVEFQDDNTTRRRYATENKGSFVKFLNRQGLSDSAAKKLLYAVGIGAFVLSLFFWF